MTSRGPFQALFYDSVTPVGARWDHVTFTVAVGTMSPVPSLPCNSHTSVSAHPAGTSHCLRGTAPADCLYLVLSEVDQELQQTSKFVEMH